MAKRESSAPRRVLLVLNCLLIALLLVFIWGNSFLNKDLSSQVSGRVWSLVKPTLEVFVGSGNATEYLVRKLAHFTEFFLLGFLTVSLCALSNRARFGHLLAASFFGLSCAAIDEGIQMFSDRSNQWSDVALDFCGCVVGAVISWLICRFLLWAFGSSKKTA